MRGAGKLPLYPISLERIVATDNIAAAWQKVKSNKGAPGLDGITISDFPYHFRECWQEIRAAILEGKYTPKRVLRVEIEKPEGGVRKLGIPTVLDRIIQQAITQVIEPWFDPHFSESSLGFRPNKSAHDAVRRVQSYIREGRKIAIDADLSKFFDRVSHDVLMARVSRRKIYNRGRATLKLSIYDIILRRERVKTLYTRIFKVKIGNIYSSLLSKLETFTSFFDFTSFDSEP